MSWASRSPRILLLGDSLTERGFSEGGWAAQLANLYSRKADVVNRGYGGYNSSWLLHVLDEALTSGSSDTAFAVVFLGANDAALSLSDGGHPLYAQQHVPIEAYRRNMREILHRMKNHGISKHVIIVTPPPVDAAGLNPNSEAGWGRSTAAAKEYAEACKELGKELGYPVVDLWSSMQAAEGWGSRLFCDGLHFTPEGNTAVFEGVLSAVNLAYPSVRAESLPLRFPVWNAVNSSEPATSFVES